METPHFGGICMGREPDWLLTSIRDTGLGVQGWRPSQAQANWGQRGDEPLESQTDGFLLDSIRNLPKGRTGTGEKYSACLF